MVLMLRFDSRVLLFCLIQVFLFASMTRAQVTVSVEGGAYRIGDAVTIPIAVGSLDGLDITSYQFTLLFPEDVIDITSVETAGTVSDGAPVIVNMNTEGQIRVALAGIQALSGAGALLELHGVVRGEDLFGERIFTPQFEEFVFFNSAADVVESAPETGTFSIKGVDFSISLLASSPGNLFALPVTVGQTTGLNIGAFQFSVKYDSNAVAFSDVLSENSLSAAGTLTYNDTENEKLLIGYAGTAPLDGAGNVLFLEGTRKTNADPGLQLANLRFFDLDGGYIPVSPEGFEATTPRITALPGEQDTLVVVLEGMEDLELDAYQFTLAYDTTVLQITGSTTVETLSQGKKCHNECRCGRPGLCRLGWGKSLARKWAATGTGCRNTHGGRSRIYVCGL